VLRLEGVDVATQKLADIFERWRILMLFSETAVLTAFVQPSISGSVYFEFCTA